MQRTKSSYKEDVTCETQLMAQGGTSRCVIHTNTDFFSHLHVCEFHISVADATV